MEYDDDDFGNALPLDEPEEILEWTVDMWMAPKIGSTKRIRKHWYVVTDVQAVPRVLTLPDGSTVEVAGASCLVTNRLIDEAARQAHREQTPSFERVQRYR